MSEKSENQSKPVEGLPFLYKEVVALNTELHADLKLKSEPDYSFTQEINAAPLMLSEFVQASSHYPIIFVTEGAVVPSVVLGIRNHENLFVDSQGKWSQTAYVPAYLRRYPFILARGEKDDLSDAALCVDTTATVLNKKNGDALIEEGKPTEVSRRAIDFCMAYAREGNETEAFCKALNEHEGLLIKRQVVIYGALAKQLSGNQDSYTLGDFHVIDETKLKELPDDVILEWHKRGWLQAAYAQIASASRWDILVRRWLTRNGSSRSGGKQ